MIRSVCIVVCTYNRSEDLIDTLKSLTEMIVPKDIIWEVIIVDNNSTDVTKAVVNKFIRDRNVNISYLF